MVLRIALSDKRGMTLIEVMISLFLFLVVSLAMLQTSVLTLDNNMKNTLRDEAVSIGEQMMSQARNTPFDDLSSTNPSLSAVNRHFKGSSTAVTYTPTLTVTTRGTDDKQVSIKLSWTWKGGTYNHTIQTLVRRPF